MMIGSQVKSSLLHIIVTFVKLITLISKVPSNFPFFSAGPKFSLKASAVKKSVLLLTKLSSLFYPQNGQNGARADKKKEKKS